MALLSFMPNRRLLACLVLTATTLSVLKTCAADTTPPTIDRLIPPAGATVKSLFSIEVLFSEAVQGVDAADLLVNGVPATDVDFGVPGQVVFSFAAAPAGPVTIRFATGHGITDLADVPFAGSNWTYTVDPNIAPATFLIN